MKNEFHIQSVRFQCLSARFNVQGKGDFCYCTPFCEPKMQVLHQVHVNELSGISASNLEHILHALDEKSKPVEKRVSDVATVFMV